MAGKFEAVIGLEVHTQLSTESKIFCACRARLPKGISVADLRSNANTCPVCAGHPGALPVLNRKVVEYAIKAGLATNCRINLRNLFARKNYFYPDLPKGYQISQYEQPICEHGHLTIETSKGPKEVHIQRIHMEEDAGKNVHLSGYSLVNLNRAGVPLVEIVSGPDMSSSEEAGAYLRALYAVVTHIGICDGNMEEGNFRCDANVSVRPQGTSQLGTRVEIKNVNSFRFVEQAIEYEISRQIEVIESGGRIVQETRLFDSQKKATFSMRSKEEAQDYRYFPEPDLIPLRIEQAWVEKLREEMPELPHEIRERLTRDDGLSAEIAGVLASSKAASDLYSAGLAASQKLGWDVSRLKRSIANLITGELFRLSAEKEIAIGESRITAQALAETAKMQEAGELSSTGAKQVIGIVWDTGESASAIVEREGLKQVSDLSALEPVVDKIIAASPAQVAEFKAGKEKLLGFFVGQVMKQTGGKANPGAIQELIRKKLLG